MECYLPQLLLESLEGLPGYDRTAFENIHTSGEQVISVRLNNRKIQSVAELAFADAIVPFLAPEVRTYSLPDCRQAFCLFRFHSSMFLRRFLVVD